MSRDAISARRPRGLLVVGGSLLAAVVLMAAAVAANPGGPITQPLDDWWRSIVGVGPEAGTHTGPIPMFFQYLGEGPGALFLLIFLPLGLAFVGRWRSGLFALTAVLVGAVLLSQLLKNLVDRPRPAADSAAGLFGPLFSVDHGSFPSGHAVTAGVMVVVVAALIPSTRIMARRVWWAIGVLILAGMVWQRTLINAHWLSDTVFGLAAGAAAGLLVWWLFWPWLQRDYGRRPWFLRSRAVTVAA